MVEAATELIKVDVPAAGSLVVLVGGQYQACGLGDAAVSEPAGCTLMVCTRHQLGRT